MPLLTPDPKYGKADADTELFLFSFNEPTGSSVLEVGANEEYAAHVLTDHGYWVTGIDLRKYELHVPCNYKRLVGDFCDLAPKLEKFDCVFSLSAIEHFGLTTYGDKQNALPFYDVVAMHHMWQVLRPGGTCYVTVPYGKQFSVYDIHWRTYDQYSICERIIQKFKMESIQFFTSGPAMINGYLRQPYKPVSREEADDYDDPSHPHVTAFLKLRK